MIRKDIKLTESQVNGFELLPNTPDPDGFYYQQGPDFLKDEDGKYRNRLSLIILWKDRVLPDNFPEDGTDFDDEP